MIIDNKKPLPDFPLPSEPPPSYEELQRVAASLNDFPRDNKSPRGSQYSPSSPGSPSSPNFLSINGKRTSSKGKSRWFPFGQAARTAAEVKKTILGLVRDVVRVPEPSAAISILRNCAEACINHNLSFSEILQEKSIEGHAPIYWAIVKRPSEPVSPMDPDLVSVLLSLASPLTDSTLSEIRLACLQNSDQVLFQRLRRLPAFSPLSGSDEILLGATVPPDEIDVQEVPGNQGDFVVNFSIPMFQKRMRITKSVSLEFIAQGRMWCLQFLASDGRSGDSRLPKDTWFIKLTLMEHSPPSWIDSRLLIEEAHDTLRKKKEKPKPTIELHIKTRAHQLAPAKSHAGGHMSAISEPLSKSLMGNSLQFDGCSYIAMDGTLSARLEATLSKTESECIIC